MSERPQIADKEQTIDIKTISISTWSIAEREELANSLTDPLPEKLVYRGYIGQVSIPTKD